VKISNGCEIFDRLGASLVHAQLPWSGEGAQAGILVALTDEAIPRVLLGRRGRHLRLHPGEIAFPGGKREREDVSPWATALREADEETGIHHEDVTPLGELEPMLTSSGFEVHPCIGKIPAELDLTIDPAEFDSVFKAPLEWFADHKLYRLEQMSKNGRTRMVPHYQIDKDNVWGVTAAVLAQLANLALDAGLELKRDWKRRP
jgi:8-oxo-dGTP pyrophosphatase MutT (NUDIX family)